MRMRTGAFNPAATAAHRAATWAGALGLMLAAAEPAKAQIAMPADTVTSYRVAATTQKFNDTGLVAVAFQPWRDNRRGLWRFEIAAGAVASPETSVPFVSAGPLLHAPLWRRNVYLEFGVSPTVLGSSKLNGRRLGGRFHFTSALAVGMTFGRRNASALALHFQHTSNAGMNRDNPGIDMLGLNVAFGLR
jgi:hypothetical protein